MEQSKKICLVATSKSDWLIIDNENYVVQFIDKMWFDYDKHDEVYAQFKSIDKWANDPVGTYYCYDIQSDRFTKGKKI